ncbi:MAG: 2-hydroxyglutaryl-CoA dehydratase [Deltaproteobacteria bacterium]|nr:2-hydroxyglutaryl-CoA dehydratase [Deltaproteobacteria bacterium]
MPFYCGVDIGSLSTDVVLLNEAGELAAWSVVETGANSSRAAAQALAEALARAGAGAGDVVSTVATGYGRVSLEKADKRVTEISCHGVGAAHLFPGVQTVIDIGGQDSKVIKVDARGKVQDFTMNDKCAAGTGRFLEVMAAKLQVGLERLGELSLAAGGEVKISSVCTVFAESEVVSLVANNHPTDQIVKGIHRAVVNRVWNMVKSLGEPGKVAMSGGVAKNRGVVALFEEKLGDRILVAPEPQIVGALGAAILARREAS